MRAFKWIFLAVLWSLIAAFFHYTLPRTDIVRIVGTPTLRVDVGTRPLFWAQVDAGTTPGTIRDVRFIEAIGRRGGERVYRNEDTGWWGWPPYFKVNSANVQARAADLTSTRADPQWVALRRYGWRVPAFSIFPNALSVRPVSGPDALVIPWTVIAALVVFFAVFWAIYVRWRRWRIAHLDARLDRFDDAWDERLARWRGRRPRR